MGCFTFGHPVLSFGKAEFILLRRRRVALAKRKPRARESHAGITKLQQVLDLLLEGTAGAEPVRRPGRLKGSSNKATSFNPEEFAPTKRTMSAEGKARIAAAQKRRWAAQKTAPAKRSSKPALQDSANIVTPTTAKKSVAGGKSTGLSRAKTQAAPVERGEAVAKKHAAIRP